MSRPRARGVLGSKDGGDDDDDNFDNNNDVGDDCFSLDWSPHCQRCAVPQ